MSETRIRILAALGMAGVAAVAILLEYFGLHGIRWLAVLAGAGMTAEFGYVVYKNRKKIISNKSMAVTSAIFFVWLLVVIAAAWHVGAKPWIMFLLLLIIVGADVGAWLFGRIIGGDKMWPALSPNKTWSGQIAGIICGMLGAIMYGYIGTAIATGHLDYGMFVPQLFWIGTTVALLSQYGDLTASWVKRKLGLKDFSKLIPGHGGLLDRFDGWIYVLPIVWLIMR